MINDNDNNNYYYHYYYSYWTTEEIEACYKFMQGRVSSDVAGQGFRETDGPGLPGSSR